MRDAHAREHAGGVADADPLGQLLRDLDFEYAALVPGSSFRGLHDSLVNLLGNRKLQLLVCLHHAVAIAHGYANVAGKPMLAVLHANVGLMHAAMAIYNAWCDRVPMLILDANGPADAQLRRPWIDWLHSSRDPGALVRAYTKWDDAPASVGAALESVVRATQIACTPPFGPTYVVLDVDLQGRRVCGAGGARRRAYPGAAARGRTPGHGPRPGGTQPGRLERAHRARGGAGARVVSDAKAGAVFRSDHPLHVGHPTPSRLKSDAAAVLREADVILSLESIDLAGSRSAPNSSSPHCSRDSAIPSRAGRLALRGSGRLGDGDYLMGVSALWTAVANRIPLLVVVANNRSHYNDVAHQERMALQRGRPVERKWIGQRLDDPAPDLALLARAKARSGSAPSPPAPTSPAPSRTRWRRSTAERSASSTSSSSPSSHWMWYAGRVPSQVLVPKERPT